MPDDEILTQKWGYRRNDDGEIDGRIFSLPISGGLPEGWQDSPAKCGPLDAPKPKKARGK